MTPEAHAGMQNSFFNGRAYTLREIIFNNLPHRNEHALVIKGHKETKLIDITLLQLRHLITKLYPIINQKQLQKGDTILLASFYSSNELANALLFAAFACIGIRIFIPIYPEANEFECWHNLTGFKAVILPYKEIELKEGHEREKEAIKKFDSLCRLNNIPFWDAYNDFSVDELLSQRNNEETPPVNINSFKDDLSSETEAVIFTTSGTSGKSKLVVYNQGAFSLSCQSWQQAGLFDAAVCGNAGFTPLFTHTIGIRSFINALWTGQPVCIMVTSWFLEKPEIARYLLLQMKPGHIVGGPAMFNTLLEFFRQFPELKIQMRETLRTVISIGAPYCLTTARQIKTALGLNLYNAFGTTETQMVLLNRMDNNKEENLIALGKSLPGVTIRLAETDQQNIYELQVHAPYQSSRILGEEKNDYFFSTGDLVQCGEEGKLYYLIRKGFDFIKDQFGVKIPFSSLQQYYSKLYEIAAHIEWLPLNSKPGLAALIFLKPECQLISNKEITEWIKSGNETLQLTVQPFEFIHRHLERISTVKSTPPVTRKGTVSAKEIPLLYEDIINKLKNPFAEETGIENIDTDEHSLLYKFSDPRLASLLETLKLNAVFEEAYKDELYYKKEGKKITVLDMAGGFGAGLAGHNHPEIKKTLLAFLDSGRPSINSQGSLYYYPSLLAASLNKLFAKSTGKFFKILFGNTGSEAMEIALHHAYYEWWQQLEKLRDEQLQLYGSSEDIDVAGVWEENMNKAAEAAASIIVINNCFHGYTSGARSLLNKKKQRIYFSGLLKPVPLHVNDKESNAIEQIDQYLNNNCILIKKIVKENGAYQVKAEKHSTIIASVIEPVQGEGGIYETNPGIITYLSQQSFPLIADEIQCGLGRTGTLPTCPNASYYLIGKSLGGGYEKISAVLIDDKRFKPSFTQYYTSTFANGEMAACAALKMLEIIQTENYPGMAHDKGEMFINKLKCVADKYPDIIESVQGKGLMTGIHFNKQMGDDNIFLRVLCENELIGYLFAGWFFHNKNIRVLPSLSKPVAIRIEPSVYISPENMNQVCTALDELCNLCRQRKIYQLLRYLMNDDPYTDRPDRKPEGIFPSVIEEPLPGALKVGFIGNFTIPTNELAFIEPDLQNASDTGLRILFNKLQILLEGKSIRLFSKNLMHGKIHFTFYILPFDTAHLEMVQRWGKKRIYITRIQDTVNKLVAEGASHISLGAHTSILSGNGLYLAEKKSVRILTGNTMTVASCLYHTEQYLDKLSAQPRSITIAIAGANGNIGSGLAGCFSENKYKQYNLLLVGNNLKKLEQLKKKLFSPDQKVSISTDLFDLKNADIIISCTNTNDPIIFSYHIHPDKKVFIIDIAVPGSVAEEVKQMSQVVFCKDASTVYLPHDPAFAISTHTPAGKVFCCAAEVMLAALYDVQLPLKGHIQSESIRLLMKLGVLENLFNKKSYAPLV